MEKNGTIYIAGHRGMLGSAILRKLEKDGYTRFILRTSSELDLRDQSAVAAFFVQEKPSYVFLAAAKVGGILANNTRRAEFLYDNLQIQNNIIHLSYLQGVKKLVFMGSSCIYPKMCPQPIKEEYLLTGTLEPTNEPYAIAKISGIKMCESYRAQYGCNFISAMPTNLYGPNDNYNLETSHVLPAFLRKFHEAKINNEGEVVVWGTGTPRREFMHVDDMARACWYMLDQNVGGELINIGTGEDVTIAEFAALMAKVVGYEGKIVYDPSKPDGTARKLLDVSKAHSFGWRHQIQLEDGLRQTYAWFVDALARGEVRGY